MKRPLRSMGAPKQPSPLMRAPVQYPQPRYARIAAGGIRGLHDDLSPTQRPLGLLSTSVNLQREGTNAAATRPGRSPFGDAVGASTALVGLSPFYKADGTRGLLAAIDGKWRRLNEGTNTWVDVLTYSTVGSFAPNNMTVFGDRIIITVPSAAPLPHGIPQYFDGTTTGQLGLDGLSVSRAPRGTLICSAYRTVFIAGVVDEPHLLHASDALDSDKWVGSLDASGNPDSGDAAAIPVNDKDGDQIMWIQLYRSNVVIWKRYTLHELHGPETGQVSRHWRILAAGEPGTVNGRTVAEVAGMMFWLSENGVVRWGGGRVSQISQPVQNIIDRINWSKIDMASAGVDEYRYFLSVPLDSSTTPNAVLVFDTRDESWWYWEGWAPTVWTRFRKSNGATVTLMGDNTGYVFEMGGTTDNGTAISSQATFGPTTGGGSFRDKLLRRAYVVMSATGGATTTVAAATDDQAAFGTAVSLSPTASLSRLMKWLPITGGDSEAYAPRLKILATGQIVIHDVGVEFQERDV